MMIVFLFLKNFSKRNDTMLEKTVLVIVTKILVFSFKKLAQKTENQGNKHLAGMILVFLLLHVGRWSVVPVYNAAYLKVHISP